MRAWSSCISSIVESRARCLAGASGGARDGTDSPLPRAPRWSVATVDGRTIDELPPKCAHQVESPRRAGGRTQRIEARLLFITQRIVEFRERGLHGLHCAKRGVEPLLHRLDTTRRGQHFVGRATDLEAFRRLDGGIIQVVERGPLRRRGLDRLADAVDWEVGDAGRLLVAKLREIALVVAGGVGIVCRRDGVERAFCSSLSDR